MAIAGLWIRYFFKVDPDKLKLKKFARLWREAEYLLKHTKPYRPDPRD